MKKIVIPKSQIANPEGFTLVELLTVIAIIGILAAMLMPALSSAIKHAKMMKAKQEITGLVTAIEGYESAYSRLPATNQINGTLTLGGSLLAANGFTGLATLDNSQVVAILMDMTSYPGGGATVNDKHQKNPKQTKFLNAKMVSDTVSPGVGTDLVYRDPWGNPYVISMDLTYNDVCEDAFYCQNNVSGGGMNGLIQQGAAGSDHWAFHGKVMVWSAGPDGKINVGGKANAGVNKDNILSWQ